MSAPANQHLKTRFLNALKEKLVVSTVCRETGIKRGMFESWKREDPSFREAVEQVEMHIIDLVKELALKRIGILPFTAAELGTGRQKWIDNSLIALFLRREQINISVNNPSPLPIAGMTPDIIASLSRPQKLEKQEGVELQGVPIKMAEGRPIKEELKGEPPTEMIQ